MKLIKTTTLALFTGLAMTSCLEDDVAITEPVEDPKAVDLYVTNHNDGDVRKYDLVNNSITTYSNVSTDAEGIYYDPSDDSFVQAERSPNARLAAFLDVNADVMNSTNGTVSVTSSFGSGLTDGLTSPRDIAVDGNLYIVSDNSPVDGDNTKGRFFIYIRESGNMTLRNIVTVNFNVWGIELVDDDLYAVVDKTNKLAKFTNFLGANTTNATVEASKTIAIAGIVRTHGLAFDDGVMVLTDIGDAASATDGAFTIITGFEQKFDSVQDGEALSSASQTRVEGSLTFLGNPVSVELFSEAGLVLIAELANGEGRVLGFSRIQSSGGNMSPVINNNLTGASSLYLYEEE